MSKKNGNTNVPTSEVEVQEAAPTPEPETAIAKVEAPGYLSPACQDMAGNPNPLFIQRYGAKLKITTKPSITDIKKVIGKLPEVLKDKITKLLQQMNPDRPGMILADDRPQFTELRINQGVGDDPNRPENCTVGTFYVTTRKNVGKEFVGTPIALWEGRTMWPSRDEVVKAPVCTSMDRIVGHKYGLCETCHNRPWKDGKQTNCSNDVVIFMLPKDLSDLIMVRFNRSSVKAGQQLITFAKKDIVQWQRWFSLTTEKKTQGERRWYEMRVAPIEGDGVEKEVPDDLLEFGGLLSSMAMHDYILPGLARIYRLAQDTTLPEEPVGDDTLAKPKGYNDFSM